jgi:predicted RNA binding protein YcfA (HicA-like mRNA interferase family)
MNSPALPGKLNFRKIRFKLEAAGFTEIRQLNNHAKFVKRERDKISTVIMPHYTEIAPSVLRSIIKQAGMTRAQFDDN